MTTAATLGVITALAVAVAAYTTWRWRKAEHRANFHEQLALNVITKAYPSLAFDIEATCETCGTSTDVNSPDDAAAWHREHICPQH